MNGAGPVSSEVRGRVAQCSVATIHGDLYYDMVIETAGEPARLRAPSHACERAPRIGDDVVVSLLLMQVQRVDFES